MTHWALAAAAVELADPSKPLGKAQAAALKASTEGPADGSAYRAVQAAKKFSGVTLNMTYEAGLQALDPRNFSGPVWEQLTGIKSMSSSCRIPISIPSRSPSISPAPAPTTSSTSSRPGPRRSPMAA